MPVHRKRPTKNFTSIENRVLRDNRLSGEAKGLLAWLLSHGPNWKIIVRVIMREMQWGRDKTYRLLGRLCEVGYVYREQERDDKNGCFGEVCYYVYSDTESNPHLVTFDEPLPDLPLPEKSKASKERNKETQEIPPTPQLHRVRENDERRISSRESERTDNGGGCNTDFEECWNAYGPEPYMSKKAAQRVWRRMSVIERQQAHHAVTRYLADCKTNNRKRVNVVRYLRDKVYEGFPTTTRRPMVTLLPNSPEWQAWHRYMIERGQSVSFMESRAKAGIGYTATAKWPPDRDPNAKK